MTKARSGLHANIRGPVKELLTQATLPALNRALLNRGINPHAIVTIVEMHGQAMAGARHPQFRVLYEIH